MALDSVTFWLNAFIPISVCEPKGNLFVLRAPNGRLFAGDQREFSADPDASARMHSEVTIDMLSSEEARIASQGHLCGESHEVDDDGKIIASATAPTNRMAFFNLRGSQTVDPNGGVIDGIPGSVQIDVAGSASLPLMLSRTFSNCA